MGQYYKVIARDETGTRVYDRSVDGEYTLAKITEHSWWRNPFCLAMSEMLVDHPTRICWCGDYAEPEECEALGFKYDEVWGGKVDNLTVHATDFSLDSVKYAVNKSKGRFVDLAKYREASSVDGCTIYPVSILTALGNGRGGGDYHGSDEDLVGSWAFDEIYLTNDLPEGLEEISPVFKEE